MKRMLALVLTASFALTLTGCGGGTTPVSTPTATSAAISAATPAPPASEQSESAGRSEASRTWTEEEVLELYKAGREEDWEMVDCVTFPDQASGLVGAVLFRNGDARTAGVAFLGADGACRMGGTDAQLPDEPEFEYLGGGAVSFRLKGEDGKLHDHTMSITIEGSNVTFKSVDQ